MGTISLNMIVKDEESNIKRLGKAFFEAFDECIVVDTGSTDGTKALLAEYGVTVLDSPWADDFASPRNVALKASGSDYVFWIDADDEVFGLDMLKVLIENPTPTAYFLRYDYSTSAKGQVTSVQWRERLFPRLEGIEWKGRCHEVLVGIEKVERQKASEAWVVHRKEQSDYVATNERNLRIQQAEFDEMGEETDPRTLYYLAQSHRGLGHLNEAAKFYTLYLQAGAWDEERYDSWVNLSDVLRLSEQLESSLIAAMEGMRLFPNLPQAYFQLAMTYFDLGLISEKPEYFAKAIEWSDTGFQKKIPETVRVMNTSRMTWQPLLIKALCHLHLDDAPLAYKLAQKALEMSDYDENALKDFKVIEEIYQGDRAVKAFLDASEYLMEKDPDRMRDMVSAFPKDLVIDSRLTAIRNAYVDPKVWSDDEIAIFCGKSLEDWADPSLLQGIGGSEESVIYVSRELVKLGYKVTVFNNCGRLEGEYRGVKYLPYYQFNPRDTFSTLISWRNGPFLGLDLTAKRTFLWLHDRPMAGQFPPEVLEKVGKVIFISKYQRECLPEVPDSKAIVSSNGLTIPTVDPQERLPHRMIWSSSYDRGIEYLLSRWGKIREAVPDAELTICYGWENFLIARSHDPRAMKWKEEVEKLMDQPGIIHLGRLSQKRLTQEFLKSSLWVYTGCFWETSCITAMRAQALGAIPVCTDYAALSETVKFGIKVPGVTELMVMPPEVADKVVDEAIALLQDPERQEAIRAEMVPAALADFTWEKVAKQWKGEIDGLR